jgi:hypothetical protein
MFKGTNKQVPDNHKRFLLLKPGSHRTSCEVPTFGERRRGEAAARAPTNVPKNISSSFTFTLPAKHDAKQ